MKKCTFFLATLLLVSASAMGRSHGSASQPTDSLALFVGSYSSPDHEGISLYGFNQRTGAFSRVSGLKGISNPSFVTVSRDGRMLYAVGEDGGKTSTLNAVRLTSDGLQMELLKSVPSEGGSPCHVNISPSGNELVGANYSGGNAVCYDLTADGLPEGAARRVDFTDGGRTSHAHFATFTPDGKQLWVTDLGLDRIHRFPVKNGVVEFTKSAMRDIELPQGSGPRHIDFSARLRKAYVIDELDGYVNVIDYASKSPRVVQRILADSVGAHGSGDIHLSPDGRYLYASNRLKADGIAIFKVDQKTGLLTHAGYRNTGPHPRNFAITPNGRFMLVACRDSNEIEVYAIDRRSGMLTPTGVTISTPKPVCLRFYPKLK